MEVKSLFGLCLCWGFCAVFEGGHSLGIPMEQFNCKLFYGEFSAGMLIRQLESKGCASFPGNKGHCTHLHPSWRARREAARRGCSPLSLGVEAPCAACVMPILCFNWLCVAHCMSLCIWQIIWQVTDYSNLLCYSSGIWEGSAYHMCCVILASVSSLVYLSPSHLMLFCDSKLVSC